MELPNRNRIEADFSARIRKLNGQQRVELEAYLSLTDPPSLDNVPPDAWQRWEDESREEYLLILLLIAAASAEFHGSTPGDEAVATALTGWATERAAVVSRATAQTTRGRLVDLFTGIDAQQAAEPFGIVELDETGQIIEAMTPRDFTTEIEESLDSLFGEKRAESIAVTETTAAQSAGGEIGIEVTVGTSPEDRWFTVNDAAVCPICTPLHQQPRSYWGRFFPDGPPGPHVGCRCWIEYVNAGKELVEA